ILTLKNHQLNKYIALFFCSIIEFEKYKFGYGRKWNLDKMLNSTFSLPTTPDGQIDWQFMEDYIKKIYNKVIEEIKASAPALLSLSLKNRLVLKCEKWKEFRVGDVFECKTTKTMLDPEQGDFLYITRTSENNGITDLIKLEDGSFLNNGNCITIGAEGLYAFYQNKDFIAGVKIYALRNEKMNKYSALFVCTMLNQVIYQYSYGRARILEKIKDEMVLLPTTPQGEPDFEWMERYMRRLIVG
ncbi:MAG: restriction endonuclease subunit S, partial [Rickettsiales bacterium]|nr:restriction endonuclease subunit S [Rickettsiales bacterium]